MRLSVLFWLFALPAAGQTVDCAQAVTQLDMTFCAAQAWQTADKVMNTAYLGAIALMQQIDADLPVVEQGAERSLRQGQRAWVTFRDATCAAEGYLWHGGSIEPMVVAGCRRALTQQRSDALQMLLETN